jgi:hypothetical protein
MTDAPTTWSGDTRRRRGIVNRVKATATAQLSTQKDRGTDALGRVAEVVRSSTEKLREDRFDLIASVIDKAADRIENWSSQLRDKDIDELVSDVQAFARRRPVVFIGSAFVLGLVGGRLLKSSPRQDDSDYSRESPRTLYGGDTGASTVHDYATRDRARD